MPHSLIKKIRLHENEQMIKMVRSHPMAFFWKIFLALILIITPFFFFYLLLQWGRTGIIILASALILGGFYTIRIFILWYTNTWIITNFKVIDIDQRRLFDRRVSEIPFEKIKDISYRTKGIISTIFQLGEIEILTSDSKLSFVLKKIYRPQEVQQLITNLQLKKVEREIEGRNLSAQDLLKLVEKIKRGVGEEKFRELVSSRE